MYKECPRRWHKAGNGVILSVQILPDYGGPMMYFGFQPLFVPFEFCDAPMKLQDWSQTFFSATQQFYRLHPKEAMKYDLLPEYHCSSIFMYERLPESNQPIEYRMKKKYCQHILRKMIIPMLLQVKDVASCHELYKKYFWGQYVSDPETDYDARYLLECIFLNEKERLAVFADKAVSRVLEYRRSSQLVLSDHMEPRIDCVELYNALKTSSFEKLKAFMDANITSALNRIKRAQIPILDSMESPLDPGYSSEQEAKLIAFPSQSTITGTV